MRKLTLITCLLLLCLFSLPNMGTVLAQRIKKHGGLIDVTSAGAVVLTPATGQGISLNGGTNTTGNATFAGTVRIGSTGTSLTRVTTYTATLTPSAVGANTCAEQTFTVTGVNASDLVFVNKPTAQAGLGVAGVRASATNTVGINFCNATGSPITPTASQAYVFGVLR